MGKDGDQRVKTGAGWTYIMATLNCSFELIFSWRVS